MASNVQAIVLAAGKSSRMKTGKSKLAEKICGQEMILYPLSVLTDLKIPTTVVVGHQKEIIQNIITTRHGDNISFVDQKEQKGTGHAVRITKDKWTKDTILIMNGDMPLVSKDIIESLLKKHVESDAAISFVTSHNEDPNDTSYGRIIEKAGTIKIVEAKEFTGDHHEFCCVNAGIYAVKTAFIKRVITQITSKNSSDEFYITDLVKLANDNNETVSTLKAAFDLVRGVNTFQELWAAEQIKRSELIKHWMENGVRFSAPQTVCLEFDVTIGAGSHIGCSAHILQGTTVGQNVRIHGFSILKNTTLEDNVTIQAHSVITDSYVEHGVNIGPFAHIRDNSRIKVKATVGNFVEVTRSIIGETSKAKHLAYIGDTTIGKNVNIGAGTITCNYDGARKNPTIIQDNAYIGSNNTIVAPVTIEQDAYTAAGSVITENVPANALAIARSRQTNKENYAEKLRTKLGIQNKNRIPFIPAVKTTNDEMISE